MHTASSPSFGLRMRLIRCDDLSSALADGFGMAEGAGYVLSHPRFGDFIRDEYLDRLPIRRTQQAFAQWGLDTLRQLDRDELVPMRVPSYLLNSLYSASCRR